MEETLIVLKCDACMLGASYQVRLVRKIDEGDARYLLQHEGWIEDGSSQKNKSEVAVSVDTVVQWLKHLSQQSVPVILEAIDGCDGVTYQLNFYGGMNHSRYQWWCEAPESYRPLVDFGNELLQAAGVHDRLEVQGSI